MVSIVYIKKISALRVKHVKTNIVALSGVRVTLPRRDVMYKIILQYKKAATAHLKSQKLLPFGFSDRVAQQSDIRHYGIDRVYLSPCKVGDTPF